MNRRNFLKGFLASGAVVALAPLVPIVEVPIASVTFESLVATTLANYRSTLSDNITRHSEVFKLFRSYGWIEEGQPIIEPLMFN